jgi:hypothetical protein
LLLADLMKFILLRFKVSLLATNHVFVTVKTCFDRSTSLLTSGSEIVILPSSANRAGVETVNIESKSLIHKTEMSIPNMGLEELHCEHYPSWNKYSL